MATSASTCRYCHSNCHHWNTCWYAHTRNYQDYYCSKVGTDGRQVNQYCSHERYTRTRVVFTDGSRKDDSAGCGVWWSLNHPDNVGFRAVTNQPDSNRAELYAAIHAIEHSKRRYRGE